MPTQSDLRAAYQIANVRAFWDVIRKTESSVDDSAYTMVNFAAPDDPARGVKAHHFSSFARHPYEGLKTTQGGFAAGAGQFIPTTWAGLVRQYSFTDFSPASQDMGYVGLLIGRGALADIVAGRFEQAVAKLRPEWTSLPGASESRPDWTMEKAKAFFVQRGGALADASAPIPDKPTDTLTVPQSTTPEGSAMPAFVAAFLPAVFQLFAGRAAEVVQRFSKAPADVAASFVSEMGQKLTDLSGLAVTDDASALRAVAAVVDDPAKMAALQDHAIDYLAKVSPFLDKIAAFEQAEWTASETAINNAAARNRATQGLPLETDRAFLVSTAILAMVGFVVVSVLWKDMLLYWILPQAVVDRIGVVGFSTDMQSFVIGAIVGGALTAVIAYFLGSNKQSAAKDAAIQTLTSANARMTGDRRQ
jgi:muramidase (phage lysozyme)